MYEQAREAVRVVPGVAAASLSMLTPLSGAGYFGPDIQVFGPKAPPARTTAARTYANIVVPRLVRDDGNTRRRRAGLHQPDLNGMNFIVTGDGAHDGLAENEGDDGQERPDPEIQHPPPTGRQQ